MFCFCSQKGAAVVTEDLDEEDEEDIDFDDDGDFEGILCSLSLIYILFCLESLRVMIKYMFYLFLGR